MTPYRFRAGPARAAPPPAPAPRERPRGIDRVALGGLIVAGLATIASIAQTLFAWSAVDTPYATLVYQQQVSRTVEAVDFMTKLRADVEYWEEANRVGRIDAETVIPEIRDRARRFADLSQGGWILTPGSQKAIGVASEHFARLAVTCLVPRYAGEEVAMDRCAAMFRRHEETLEAAKAAVLRDIRFDYRNAAERGQ